MGNLVGLMIDGQQLEVAEGTLVIEAARQAGILIPSFCYSPGLTLQVIVTKSTAEKRRG